MICSYISSRLFWVRVSFEYEAVLSKSPFEDEMLECRGLVIIDSFWARSSFGREALLKTRHFWVRSPFEHRPFLSTNPFCARHLLSGTFLRTGFFWASSIVELFWARNPAFEPEVLFWARGRFEVLLSMGHLSADKKDFYLKVFFEHEALLSVKRLENEVVLSAKTFWALGSFEYEALLSAEVFWA